MLLYINLYLYARIVEILKFQVSVYQKPDVCLQTMHKCRKLKRKIKLISFEKTFYLFLKNLKNTVGWNINNWNVVSENYFFLSFN